MKRRWVWIGVFTALILAALVAIGTTNHPPFRFISQFHGERILNPGNSNVVLWHNNGITEYFSLKGSPQEVQQAMREELPSLGWRQSWSLGDSVTFTDAPSTGGFIVSDGNDQTATLYWGDSGPEDRASCYLVVQRKLSWLERQWAVVKGWVQKPEPDHEEVILWRHR